MGRFGAEDGVEDPRAADAGWERELVARLTRRDALRRGAAGLGVLSLPGLLAACGGERGGDETAAGQEAAEDAPLRDGGTLVIAVDALTGNSDPAVFATFGNWMAIDLMARGLTHIDYGTTEPRPGMAERWEVSGDGLTYRFSLRAGMTFHDGNPVTAADAERSWRRLMDEEDASRPEGTYSIAELGGANVRRVRAVDELTFEVRLGQPDVAFLSRCSNCNGAILSAAAIDRFGKRVGNRLVGAGPFRFGESRAGQSLTVERFPEYWEGAPKLERVVLQVLPDPTSLTSALQTGSAQLSPFVPFSNVRSLKASSKLRVAEGKPYIDVFVGMNVAVPLLRDLKVRQAINYAIDRQAIVQSAFGGAAQLPAGLIPPPELGYSKELEAYSRQDLPRARQLIQEAGAEGQAVEIVNQNILFWPRIGQIVDTNLAAIGLRPRSEYLDEATYNERQYDPEGHELFVNQRSAFVPDPDNKLSPLLAKDSFVNQVQTQNFRLDSQAELDRRLRAALAETDQDARRELYVDLQRFLQEEVMVFAMLAYIAAPVVSTRAIGGVNANAMGTYRTFVEKVGFVA